MKPVGSAASAFAISSLTWASSPPTFAQPCQPAWSDTFASADFYSGYVNAFIFYGPDGPGPEAERLIAGGSFYTRANPVAFNIAQLAGKHWVPIGSGLSGGQVRCLTLFDEDGDGPAAPALCAGGSFRNSGTLPVNRVARWDGTSWSAFGAGLDAEVYALVSFDEDGPGPLPPALYAAGALPIGSGQSGFRVARWDGKQWISAGPSFDDWILTFEVFDEDPTDQKPALLYSGGYFTACGSVPLNHVARWNGKEWFAAAEGVNGTVWRLKVMDEDLSGPKKPRLFAGGQFTKTGNDSASWVAAWDGQAWRGFGKAPVDYSRAKALAVFDADGDGPLPPTLYAGGYFRTSGATTDRTIIFWDGDIWRDVASGVRSDSGAVQVYDMIDVQDEAGWGRGLYVGGRFDSAGAWPARYNTTAIARWDGSQWFGFRSGVEGQLYASATTTDPNHPIGGASFFVGGVLFSASGRDCSSIVGWDGESWFSLPPGNRPALPRTLHVWDADDAGPEAQGLYVGGIPSQSSPAHCFARWDGATFLPLGLGMDGCGFTNTPEVRAITSVSVVQSGSGPLQPGLYVAGYFVCAGGIRASCIARWDGQAWLPLGDGVAGGANSLLVFDDDGSGPLPPVLIVGGDFNDASGVRVNSIARWDGIQWSALGSGIGGSVRALAALDEDGDGPIPPTLYAGGQFSPEQGAPADHVARWNGTAWESVGAGIRENVLALCAFDEDGPGPNPPSLFAGGEFYHAGVGDIRALARWDGDDWRVLGEGLYGDSYGSTRVDMMVPFDADGNGPAPPTLLIGGSFTAAGSIPSLGITVWTGCPSYGDLNCDGGLDGVDIGAFVLALLDPPAYANAFRACGRSLADLNQDGLVGESDIAEFAELLLASTKR